MVNIPKDSHLQTRCCENLKSHLIFLDFNSFSISLSTYSVKGSVHAVSPHIAHPEEKWHNSKLPFFRRSNLMIIFFFLIWVFKIEESVTANTYVGKKGILHT
jgi:hypothetical protein